MPRARRRSPPAGACPILADPGRPADEQAVFWLPDRLAATVILTPCDGLPVQGGLLRFMPETWPGLRAIREAPAGVFVKLGDAVQLHRLWLAERPPDGTPLAASSPLDGAAKARMVATYAFYKYMAANEQPRANSMPRRHRARTPHVRLAATLTALDAHLAGANYRDIAELLYGTARVAAEPWKTSPLRDTAIRHVRRGLELTHGGYARLLSAAPH